MKITLKGSTPIIVTGSKDWVRLSYKNNSNKEIILGHEKLSFIYLKFSSWLTNLEKGEFRPTAEETCEYLFGLSDPLRGISWSPYPSPKNIQNIILYWGKSTPSDSNFIQVTSVSEISLWLKLIKEQL